MVKLDPLSFATGSTIVEMRSTEPTVRLSGFGTAIAGIMIVLVPVGLDVLLHNYPVPSFAVIRHVPPTAPRLGYIIFAEGATAANGMARPRPAQRYADMSA